MPSAELAVVSTDNVENTTPPAVSVAVAGSNLVTSTVEHGEQLAGVLVPVGMTVAEKVSGPANVVALETLIPELALRLAKVIM